MELVDAAPLLDDLAFRDPVNRHLVHGDLGARGRDAPEFAAVRAGGDVARGHAIALRDHVHDVLEPVGKRRAGADDAGAYLVEAAPLRLARAGRPVAGEVGMKDLGDHGEVARVPQIVQPAHDRLVLFDRHCRSPQNTARGLAGEPVPPFTRSGEITSMNSSRRSSWHALASPSRKALSRSAVPYAKIAACTAHGMSYPFGIRSSMSHT